MGTIRDIHNPWRDQMQPASFRGAMFHVDIGARNGGRRVALHEYPKRNDPYAEDMGRRARRFTIQGYLIGPNYLDLKNALLDALDADGPGTLRLPFTIRGGTGGDMEVMNVQYSVTEARERGGVCTVDMDFVEAGKPGNAQPKTSSPAAIMSSSLTMESAVAYMNQNGSW
jgi:prophage DNA circulation protein